MVKRARSRSERISSFAPTWMGKAIYVPTLADDRCPQTEEDAIYTHSSELMLCGSEAKLTLDLPSQKPSRSPFFLLKRSFLRITKPNFQSRTEIGARMDSARPSGNSPPRRTEVLNSIVRFEILEEAQVQIGGKILKAHLIFRHESGKR
ncbi:hypothetical protein NMY22_g5743 [Coprinellus aureogranulatus]|nr:hypothetical protein NMY22_g5743 [Coprinellus aureogranulatus]